MQRIIVPKRWSSSSQSNAWAFSKIPTQTIDEVQASASDPNALADIVRPYFEKQSPVILRGAARHFPAVHYWQTWDYLEDTLPASQTGGIELGGSYSEETSERAEIPFHDYVQYLKMFEERRGRTPKDRDPWQLPTEIQREELVYMAQNDLPSDLYKDVEIPPFCEDPNYSVGLGRLYSVMWWLGPRASTSPLHYDPLDNLLMQIMGCKVVWLFSPQGGGGNWHYAGHNGQQKNTSPINPEQYDAQKYPLLMEQGPPAMPCLLEPGDILYIPSKFWHYVRSVDTSASVNVWWR